MKFLRVNTNRLPVGAKSPLAKKQIFVNKWQVVLDINI